MRPMILSDAEFVNLLLGKDFATLKNDYDVDFANQFYRLLPILVKASHDDERLNSFAPVLTFCRWAKAQGARFIVAPKVPSRVTTPDAVRIYGGAINAITPFVPLQALEETAKRADACIKEMEQSENLR